MLVYITGVPGAGKTYYAVNYIFENKDKFSYVYTNIAGFKFQDNIKPYVHKELYPKISKLYVAYKKQVEEKELVKLAQDLDLYNALFVIDEAQNIFMQLDQVLVWWLTYHRHLSQDIILITQNLSLINSKYKPLAEKFIKALPSSMRVFSNVFRYNVYTDARMYNTTKVATEKIKFKKEVYELYHSGKAEKHKSFILKFAFLGLIGVFITGGAFYLISTLWMGKGQNSSSKSQTPSKPQKVTNIDKPQEHKNQQLAQNKVNFSTAKLLRILCIDKKCSIEGFDIPYDKLHIFIDPYDLIDLDHFDYKGHKYITLVVLSSSPRIVRLKEEKKFRPLF